jgi:hypothetical protein
MSGREAPAWLAAFQERFSAMLRTPLDRGTGTLRARIDRYDPALVGEISPEARAPGEGLAVYNRQYWFRLFGALQSEHRLACALAGAWAFNDLAARFLAAHPPRGHDLGRAADGLAAWVKRDADQPRPRDLDEPPLPPRALAEAVDIDAAYRALFWADERAGLDEAALGSLDARALATSRLVPSDRFVVVVESWALLALRARLPAAPVTRAVPLPDPVAGGPRPVALHRAAGETRALPLDPLQARLLALLCAGPVGEALARLELECPPARVDRLAADVRRWLADSLRLGFWRALDR